MIKEYQLRRPQNSYEVVLYYKGIKVHVAFTNGNTYKGINPTALVKETFKQRAIEASQPFKDKEIVLVRSIEEESDKAPKTVPHARRAAMNKPVTAKPATQPTPAKAEPDTKPEPTPVDEGTQNDGAKNEMNFDSVDEAILYIAQNFQQEATTEKEAREILKANGITPHIKKG